MDAASMDMAEKMVSLQVRQGTHVHWRRIGAAEGLPGDSEIGAFLVQLYSAAKNGSQALHHCFLCRGPLSAVCNTCRSSQSSRQPSTLQDKSQLSQASANMNHFPSDANKAPLSSTLKCKCWKPEGEETLGILYSSSDNNAFSAPSGTSSKADHSLLKQQLNSDFCDSAVSDRTNKHGQSSQQTHQEVTSDHSDQTAAEKVKDSSDHTLTRQNKQHQPRLNSVESQANPELGKEEVCACKTEPLSSDTEEESENNQWSRKADDPENEELSCHGDAISVSNSQKIKTESESSDPENSHSEGEGDNKEQRGLVSKLSSDSLCIYMGVEDLPKQLPSSIDHSYTEQQKLQKVPEDAVFICKVCGKSFQKRHRLVNHIGYLHCHWRPFQCQVCPASFQSKQRLRRHGYVVHTKERPYRCRTCEASFVDRFGLSCHQRTHQADRQHRYFCELCGKGYHSLNPLKKHLLNQHRQHHSGKKVSSDGLAKTVLCWVCGKAVASATYLKLHMRKHSPETAISCDVCCRSFTSRQTLDKHLNSRLHQNRLEEREVTHSFLQEEENKAKKLGDGEEGDLRTVEQSMDKSLSSLPELVSSSLPSSLSSSVSPLPSSASYAVEVLGVSAKKKQRNRTAAFQCEICYKPLSSQKSVKRHKRDIHQMHEEKKKKIVFYEEDSLPTQQQRPETVGMSEASTTETNLADPERNVGTGVRNEEKLATNKLTRQIPLPSDVAFCESLEKSSKKFTCDICHRSFALRQSVRRHKRHVHLKRRDYHCEQCSKTFSTSYYLKQHQLIHRSSEGDARHTTIQCDVCHKDFVRKSAMVAHKRNVHYGLHRQSCAACGKKLRDKFSLARHHKLCCKQDVSLTQTKAQNNGGIVNDGAEHAKVDQSLSSEPSVQAKTGVLDACNSDPKELLVQHFLPAPSMEMSCAASSGGRTGAAEGNLYHKGMDKAQVEEVSSLRHQPSSRGITVDIKSATIVSNSSVSEALLTSLSSSVAPLTSNSIVNAACMSSKSYTAGHTLLSDLDSMQSVTAPASFSPECVPSLTSDLSKQLPWSPSTSLSSNSTGSSSPLVSNAAMLTSHPALLVLHSSLLASNLVPQEPSPTLLMQNYAAFSSNSGLLDPASALTSDSALLTPNSVSLVSTSGLLVPNSSLLASRSALIEPSSASLASNSPLFQPNSTTNPTSAEAGLAPARVLQVSGCTTKPLSLLPSCLTPTSTLSALDSSLLVPLSLPSTSESGFVSGPPVASSLGMPCFTGFSPISSWMNTAASFDAPVESQGEDGLRPESDRLAAQTAPPQTGNMDTGDLWNLR